MSLTDRALERPATVVIAVISIALCALLALKQMKIDIFPTLNMPVIYVAQPYGGMSPTQMEGFLVNYYEYHFLYVTGIEHVESRSIQNVGLIKLVFHPDTDMNQALAQTISYVERSRAFMPPGTVAPFVVRFDAGTVPVGYLVFSSMTRSLNEIQDLALFRVRPKFATLPGVSSPPPFGGNQRTIVVDVKPDLLRSHQMSADEVVRALTEGNTIVPSGNVRTGSVNRMTPFNSVVSDINELLELPIRKGVGPTVFVGDVATVRDSSDILTGYALVNGNRTVYIPVTKRANASTVAVVDRVKAELPNFQSLVPEDIEISFAFDQSTIVKNSIFGLAIEAGLGAILTGLMVLIFLRDVKTAAIVTVTIPFSLLAAIVALWLSGETMNIMTLGGLALAVGILVDEATVTVENIHSHLERGQPIGQAALEACRETLTPRLLAMLAIIAVFVPSFFMTGSTRALFVPLSLAVGYSMLASYFLSSTLVPVLSIWFLRKEKITTVQGGLIQGIQEKYRLILERLMQRRWLVLAGYLSLVGLLFVVVLPGLGQEIFPISEGRQFQVRLRAPTGTRVEKTELVALKALDLIKQVAGPENVEISLAFVGTQPPSYPINTIYLFTSGPQEAVLLVELRRSAGVNLNNFIEKLRGVLAQKMPDIGVSFEAGDVVTQIMNFGASTPIEVAISGHDFKQDKQFASKILSRLKQVSSLRDLQYGQPQDYPTIEIAMDRKRGGQLGVTVSEVGRSLLAATSSSRWVVPNYWADPKTGIGYQLQVEIPQFLMDSLDAVKAIPVMANGQQHPVLADVADVEYSTMPGEIDRYNMQRMITITANVAGEDLGRAATQVRKAIQEVGTPPRGVSVNIRGQVPVMQATFFSLLTGLGIAVLAIFLLMAANFQSGRLALVVLSATPAVIGGVIAMLAVTNTTINIESFIGTIMAIGVGVANAILLVTFSEQRRLDGDSSQSAAIEGAVSRLRPILMTSIAMVAGMIPMAIGLGEGGSQTAPLGRAVIGGLVASLLTVLLTVPVLFSIVQSRATRNPASLHPDQRKTRGVED